MLTVQLIHTDKDTFPRSSRSVEAAGCPEQTGPAVQTHNMHKARLKSRTRTRTPSSPSTAASSYIVVFEEAEHPQLPEDPLAGHEVLEDVGHLLQGHLAAVPGVSDRPGEGGRETGPQFSHKNTHH